MSKSGNPQPAIRNPQSAICPPTSGLRPLILAGPTAAGKSEIALRLAELLSGEIISVDSMQVYRGMDIGTAKPSPADRTRVPHHLIDLVDPDQAFDAAQFVACARRALEQIQLRGRTPVLCGGTGLYFKALLEGLGESPAADPALRAKLEAMPLPELLRELERNDPECYAGIDRANPRRVIRAVEVIRLTGKPFSQQRAPWNSKLKTQNSKLMFGFRRPPMDLRMRIDTRVERMFEAGLVAETERLLKRGLAENRTACQALGYRQVIEHLRGNRSLAETIELVKVRTRQFAKRQMTWFQKQLALEWIDLEPSDTPDAMALRVAALVRARS